MSTPNENTGNKPNDVSSVSVSFDTFLQHYNENPDLDNKEYYETFPSVNQGTIRSWKAKARSMSPTPTSTPQGTPSNQPNDDQNSYMDLLITELIGSTRIDPNTLKGLDKKAQIQVLQNIKLAQTNTPDPNIRMMTPPTAGGRKATGFDQYIKIDEKAFREKGFGKVEIVIPASVAHDPEKNATLRR